IQRGEATAETAADVEDTHAIDDLCGGKDPLSQRVRGRGKRLDARISGGGVGVIAHVHVTIAPKGSVKVPACAFEDPSKIRLLHGAAIIHRRHNEDRMNVLVTGGTGFLGSNLVHHLVSRGDRVRVLKRPASSMALLEGLPIEVVAGDVT